MPIASASASLAPSALPAFLSDEEFTTGCRLQDDAQAGYRGVFISRPWSKTQADQRLQSVSSSVERFGKVGCRSGVIWAPPLLCLRRKCLHISAKGSTSYLPRR